MSFENLNAENRNNFLIPRLTRRQPCCSFCRNNGHNIRSCVYASIPDATYREFEAQCSRKVMETNTRFDFKNWLIENYNMEQDLLRGFTLKKTGYIIMEPFNSITEYIYNTYKEQIIMEDDNGLLENEFPIFLAQLQRQRREINPFPEIHEVRAMERILMMDYIEFIMRLPSNIIRNVIKKPNIISLLENDDNKNINEKCECSICLDENEIENFVKLGCNHEFCKDCVIKTMKISHSNLCCALCRSEVTSITSRTNLIHNEMAEFIA